MTDPAPAPKVKQADAKEFLICPICSEKAGMQVPYHKSVCGKRRRLFGMMAGGESFECPFGHDGLTPMFEEEKPS